MDKRTQAGLEDIVKRAEDVAIEAIEASRFWSSAVNVNKASDIIRADREEVIDAVEARLLGKDGHYLDTHQTFSREDIEVALNVFKAEIGGEV